MNRPYYIFAFVAILLLQVSLAFSSGIPERSPRIYLRSGWNLQSSCKAAEAAEVISSAGHQPNGWYTASVPTTVVAAQVAAGDYPDPYFGMNLRKLPGMDYPIGEKFSVLPMSKESPYVCSWW